MFPTGDLLVHLNFAIHVSGSGGIKRKSFCFSPGSGAPGSFSRLNHPIPTGDTGGVSGTGPYPKVKEPCPATRRLGLIMAVWNLMATVALYIAVVSSCVSDEFQSWCHDTNQTRAEFRIQGFHDVSAMACSVSGHFKFETSEWCAVISAVDGSRQFEESEVTTVHENGNAGSCQDAWCDWSMLYMYISKLVEQVMKDKDTLAFMMALMLLVAMNTGLVAIAVLRGQMTVATSMNLVLILHFCFEYLQKRKHAWKQKTRRQRQQSCLSQHCAARKLRVLLIFAMFGNSWAMDAGMASQIAELARAATMAATAASSVAEKVGVKSMSAGMESASKVLKNPHTFNGEDPTSFSSWKLTFETWMAYGDDRFGELLGKVERMTKPPIYSTYDSEKKAMANKFFAILSIYVRGRTSALVRSVASDEKDGFRLCFELCKECLPSSKQRTLSLTQTLAQYPSFNSKSSMLEQILNFEQLVGQYECSSGNVYPGDLKGATILRCSPARVREYLKLSLKEESTYSDIREALLAYERVTKGYTSEQLVKQVQSTPDSEATPMEVE